ncbi:MAG: hypothetical protein UT53_C0006G0006 [Candidatus Yanofskybacteria bacterium GW2011_GWD2_39_48]|uniref:Uncharacterized protein n=1 Tax=Candidatus Yanofskybacteria bacterium GW2011_GWD2_39_48 TaxID=1619031 RepID=A0A0G0PF81_9BACT|nr:MAG: hypothetical protein UT53_C0006G0006 [Candidatus Yanofskybacteria bacterium GW2011_GWD2_39_48]
MEKNQEALKKHYFPLKNLKAYFDAVVPPLSYALQPLFDVYPYWGLVFYNAVGFIGLQMSLNIKDVEDIVSFIKNNGRILSENVVNSENFKRAFLSYLETYLKLRIAEKKKILNEILLGYAKSKSSSGYCLEHFEDCLLKITPSCLNYLVFIKKEILPYKDAYLKKELSEGNQQYTKIHNYDWWYDENWRREQLWRFLQSWYHENYNPNSEKVKKQYGVADQWDKGLIEEVFEKEKLFDRERAVNIEELILLGILKLGIASGGGFGMAGGATYDFSDFGYKFLVFIDNSGLPDFVVRNFETKK